ncbi:Gfo/Idh/MocA family protein [Cohnella boryungensis]|uniref:Gfo/Idh/MocA family protein n=1 Tax=Cohnella boryungensis TaxID=768479 RepID=A0ABV8S4S7_9BACL
MEWLKPEHYLPKLDPSVDAGKYGIGLVGCGTIANQAHLPAYRKLNLPVVACCDVNADAARTTAEKFGIPFWTTDIRELLARDDVKVIDMAVHYPARLPLLREVAKAPRPVLCQKPLALNLQQARELGDFARDNGIVLGVNHQARWAPAHKALQLLVDQGLAGQIYSVQHVMRAYQDQPGMWWTTMNDFNIADHGIHYIDLCRNISKSAYAGQEEWSSVNCLTAVLPGQNAVDPLIYSANIAFGPDGGRHSFMASLQFNNIVRATTSHSYTWWVDGTAGSIWGGHDKLYVSLAGEGSTVHEIRIKGSWFPDGFAGSMAAFITALDRGEACPVTPEDNYNTIALTSAMVISSRENRVVHREELMRGGEDDE